MPTINGVEFIAERPSSGAHSKKSQQNTPPGTDVNPITRFGINGFQMQLNVVEDHLDVYDSLVAEFMKQQELIIILREGWEYHVEALGVQFPDLVIELGEKYRFTVPLISETPYQFSVDEVTVSKLITANNETWSAGDDGTNLATTGTVPAVPSISITGGAVGSSYTRDNGHTDSYSNNPNANTGSTTYILVDTKVFSGIAFLALQGNLVKIQIRISGAPDTAQGKITIQATSLFGGVETTVLENSTGSASFVEFTANLTDLADVAEDMTFRWYVKRTGSSFSMWYTGFYADVIGKSANVCTDAQILNTADTTTVMDVANELLLDAVQILNSDGTGSHAYADDFTTAKYINAAYSTNGITHDTINDELDIAADGFLNYKIDTKYPIIGVPELISQINITAGTPTLQISLDDITWYDIDTSIVDNVSTVYPLNNAASLELDGESLFYFRFKCGAGVTLSIIDFSLTANIGTADSQHPVINIGGANTWKCVQDAGSSMNCEVDTIFNHRKWAA